MLAGVRRLFTPLALVCLALAGYAARDTVQALLPAANVARLVVVVLAWAALQALVPALAAVLLRGLGAPIGYRATLRMHLSRLPARYLPGGIWQTVARAADLQALGVARRQRSRAWWRWKPDPACDGAGLAGQLARHRASRGHGRRCSR